MQGIEMTREQMIDRAVRRQRLSRRYLIAIFRRAETAREYLAGKVHRAIPPLWPDGSYSTTPGGVRFYVGPFSRRPYCVDNWSGKTAGEIAFDELRAGTLRNIRANFRQVEHEQVNA